jgi:DNA polymerase-3 subunit beta
MSIGFNVGYVLDVLGVIDTSQVQIKVADPNSSALISNKDEDSNLYVIMPMRL